jgi:hypothetical protein
MPKLAVPGPQLPDFKDNSIDFLILCKVLSTTPWEGQA